MSPQPSGPSRDVAPSSAKRPGSSRFAGHPTHALAKARIATRTGERVRVCMGGPSEEIGDTERDRGHLVERATGDVRVPRHGRQIVEEPRVADGEGDLD